MAIAELRNEVDNEIARDGRALRETCMLLQQRRPVSEWPPLLREAFRVALNPDPEQRREVAKAARLERHLFGIVRQPQLESVDVSVGRVADRLRADLADLVPFGSGFYLIDYDTVVAEWPAANRSV